MLKNTWLLLLASLPALGYSAEPQCCEAVSPPEPIESCQVQVGYFYPAQYTFGDCGYEISFGGEFIYWEVNRDSLTSVGTLVEFSNNGLAQDQRLLAHHQGYRPGFKVAAGMGLPGCDDWKLDVEYTWFHHTSTNHFSASPTGQITPPLLTDFFSPLTLVFGGYAASALKSELKFNTDYIHGIVGRAFYISQRLVANVGIGLKAWWSSLQMDLTFNTIGAPIGRQRTKTSLWGIGPYALAQLKGLLWCGTYLYGKAGIWPTYTRFTKQRVDNNFPGFFVNVETIQTFYYQTQLFYEGGAGLGWGTYLCDCNYHIDLLIGYDMMTNYIRAFFAISGNPHREFYSQGLFVKAQFDF